MSQTPWDREQVWKHNEVEHMELSENATSRKKSLGAGDRLWASPNSEEQEHGQDTR